MFKWVRNQKNKKGFTLLELIVVMAVLAILVAMGVPRFLGYTKDAAVTAMKADAGIIESACMQYALMSETGEDWPIGGEVTEGLNDLAAAFAAVIEEGQEVPTFYAIDKAKIDPYIRSTSNEIEDFVLVVDGEYEGEVFHKAGVKDKDGVTWFGIELRVPVQSAQ